jgi:hypothetical protein
VPDRWSCTYAGARGWGHGEEYTKGLPQTETIAAIDSKRCGVQIANLIAQVHIRAVDVGPRVKNLHFDGGAATTGGLLSLHR